MKLWAMGLLFCVFMLVNGAHALLTTSTLPAGINSPSFRFGVIEHVGERYTSDGSLMRLGDLKSIVFDAATLKKMNADAQKLIDALNSFGDHKLGDQFNFGVLRVHTTPKVSYFAPIFAHGFTENWTLALGLPVVTYKNKIFITQDSSNIAYYRSQFSGLSKELDAALNIDLGKATNETLQAKGYKDLESRDENFLGDTQVASVYKFFENSKNALIYQALVGLPTGPGYNSDDLAALNIFGRTTVSNTLAYSYKFTSRFSVLPYASYLVNIKDQVTARVPKNEDDSLPDASAKQVVARQIGNTTSLGGNAFYELNDEWTLGTAYEMSQKTEDRYVGSAGTRYDLLSRNTELKAERVKAEVTYSSVKSYFNKSAILPMMVSVEVSDVIAGYNVERQLVQEMNLMLFF
jgi:hypothetical protein